MYNYRCTLYFKNILSDSTIPIINTETSRGFTFAPSGCSLNEEKLNSRRSFRAFTFTAFNSAARFAAISSTASKDLNTELSTFWGFDKSHTQITVDDAKFPFVIPE